MDTSDIKKKLNAAHAVRNDLQNKPMVCVYWLHHGIQTTLCAGSNRGSVCEHGDAFNLKQDIMKLKAALRSSSEGYYLSNQSCPEHRKVFKILSINIFSETFRREKFRDKDE